MVNPTSRPGEFVVLEDRIYRCPCGVGQIRGPMKILVGAVAWCKGCGDEFDIARALHMNSEREPDLQGIAKHAQAALGIGPFEED